MYRVHYYEIVNLIVDFVKSCDADELARIFEECYGYKTWVDESSSEDLYLFCEKTELSTGALDCKKEI